LYPTRCPERIAAVQPAIAERTQSDAGVGAPVAERLTLGTKLAFGAPTFAGAAMAIPLAIHLTIFYSDVILVPLGVIALAKSLGRAFDALTDPLMGWVTDRTRSRWGRRRPWLALGAPGTALAFFAMFAPPEALGPAAAGAWLGAMYIVYSIFQTIYQIPLYGLGAELTLDYRERNSLFSVEQAFSVAGTLFASAVPGLLAAQLGARRGYFWFAAVFGGLLVLLMWNLVRRVRERADFATRPANPLVPGVRRVLRNRAFRLLLAVYLVGALTGAIPGTLMPYFVTYVLKPEGAPLKWISLFLFLYFGTGLLCLPLWVWLANRIGKKATWLLSFVSGGTGSLALYFVPEGDVGLFGVILVWAGSSFAARLFLGPSIQADVIDYDELLTGKRREAQYGGLWSIMTKFAVIPSLTIPLAVLATLGYEPNVEQSEEVKLAIRAIFALAPALTALVAFAVACFFPITQQVHQRIWEGIEAHKRGESAQDPLSGASLAPPSDRGVSEDAGWFLDHFSRGELRRALGSGPNALVRDAAFWLGVSLVLCVAGTAYVLDTVRSLSDEPGLLPVLALVVAGLTFNAVVFHLVRLRAALVHRRRPFDAAILRAHLGGASTA
jgi:GPH family glycoside/pentoside/hexuronide:cation symporter